MKTRLLKTSKPQHQKPKPKQKRKATRSRATSSIAASQRASWLWICTRFVVVFVVVMFLLRPSLLFWLNQLILFPIYFEAFVIYYQTLANRFKYVLYLITKRRLKAQLPSTVSTPPMKTLPKCLVIYDFVGGGMLKEI